MSKIVYYCLKPYFKESIKVTGSKRTFHNWLIHKAYDIFKTKDVTIEYVFKDSLKLVYAVYQPRDWNKEPDRYLMMTFKEVIE